MLNIMLNMCNILILLITRHYHALKTISNKLYIHSTNKPLTLWLVVLEITLAETMSYHFLRKGNRTNWLYLIIKIYTTFVCKLLSIIWFCIWTEQMLLCKRFILANQLIGWTSYAKLVNSHSFFLLFNFTLFHLISCIHITTDLTTFAKSLIIYKVLLPNAGERNLLIRDNVVFQANKI